MKNDSLKIVLIVAIIAIAGYFLYTNFAKTDAGQQGAVISGTSSTTSQAGVRMTIGHTWIDYIGSQCLIIVYDQFGMIMGTIWGSTGAFGICVPGGITMTNNGNPSGISGVSVGTNGTLSITGDLVKATQLKLLMLGYMKTVPTGVLDSVTTEALRGYQTANKLQITGTITPETNTSLNSYIGAVSVTKNTNPSLSIGATSVK